MKLLVFLLLKLTSVIINIFNNHYSYNRIIAHLDENIKHYSFSLMFIKLPYIEF